jgi:hypothetical protein
MNFSQNSVSFGKASYISKIISNNQKINKEEVKCFIKNRRKMPEKPTSEPGC